MNEQFTPESEIWALFDAACGDALDVDQVERLEAALRADERLCDLYLDYFRLHAELSRSVRLERTREKIVGAIRHPESVPIVPPIVFDLSSTTNYPLTTSYFSVGSWAFSYMVSAVILGVAALGGLAYKVTLHQPQVAEAPSKSVPSDIRPEMVFVGRITGMVNVKWSDDKDFLPPLGYDYVPLGRKYKLVSGLMQITYGSGAKVILEGPCTYEVESSAGGYLALGKLTARIEERREKREERSRTADSTSSLIPHPSSLFSVRTPTAVVTDLGTEFAVEVTDAGPTEVHAFAGEIVVQRTAVNGVDATTRRLKAGQAVRIDRRAGSDPRAIELDGRRFIREMSLAAIAKRAASSSVAASTFDLGTEGWTVSVDGTNLAHHVTDGASGWYIQTDDLGRGDIFYFIAPKAFHGDRSRAYRSHLAFDLWINHIDRPGSNMMKMMEGTDAVVVTGGGKSIAADVTAPKLDEWTHYSIPLCGLGHWRRVDRPGSPPASEQDILDVLSDIKDLRIRGEFIGGWDTAGLDNVILREVTGTARINHRFNGKEVKP